MHHEPVMRMQVEWGCKVITVGAVLQEYQNFCSESVPTLPGLSDQSLQKPSHLYFIDYLAPMQSEVPDSKL